MQKTTPNYAITQRSPRSFEQAVIDITNSLKEQGFGILTQVDVRDTLKQKLGVDYQPYLILGACNPPNAYKTLQLEKEIGLLLPCNVIVYQEEDNVYISIIKPTQALTLSDNQHIVEIAQTVEQKLIKALNQATKEV